MKSIFNREIKNPLLFPRIFLYLSIFMVIFGVILNFNLLFFGGETSYRHMWILRTGDFLNWGDFKTSLNWKVLDVFSRLRIIDHFFSVFDIRFRMYIFKYLPFHPSFSLTWVFTSILAPYYLFKFTLFLYQSRATAYIATSLYLLSSSHLSSVSDFNRPAKPLSLFLFIFILSQAANVSQKFDLKKWSSEFNKEWLKLLILLFISGFLDEFMWFTYLAVPCFFSEWFLKGINRIKLIIQFVLVPVSVLFVGILIFPKMYEHFGYGGFNLLNSAINKSAPTFSFLNFPINAFYLIGSHLIPNQLDWQNISIKSLIFISGFFVFFVFLYFKIKEKVQQKVLSSLLLLVLFFIFHTVVMSKHMGITKFGAFYYGGLVTFPIVLILAPLLTIENSVSSLRYGVSRFILTVVCLATHFVFFQNYKSIATQLIEYFNQRSCLVNSKIMPLENPLTFTQVQSIWKNRDNEEALKIIIPSVQQKSAWIFKTVQLYPPHKGIDVFTGKPLYSIFDETFFW